MSPAGAWPQLQAAVEAGADAVYFGLKHFSARAKVGFSLDELPSVMRTLHQRGVAGYITFNTLVFEHELDEAARAIAAIAEAGADALIVQDYGVVRLARAIVPGMALHASTQMSISDVHGVRLAQSFGLNRVTLARELALAQISQILAATRLRIGDLRPRRALRGVLRTVLFVRSLGWTERQSRPVCAGLPAALRPAGGRPATPARRRPLPALAGRPDRPGPDPGNRRNGRGVAQDRRPLQRRRLCRPDHGGLPQGRRRRLGRPRDGSQPGGAAAPGAGSIRAGSGRTSSAAPIIRPWCVAARRAIAAC